MSNSAMSASRRGRARLHRLIDRARLASALGAQRFSWTDEVAPGARLAAVALPLALGPAPVVYAVLRSERLRDHPGEVAFPGGKIEASDASPEAAALRELAEEVGVVDAPVLGALSALPVVTGKFLVHPFVVELPAGVVPRITSEEIDEILTVPLLPLLSAEVRGTPAPWRGLELLIPSFRLEARKGPVTLYGASAFFLYDLLGRIAATFDRPPPPLVRTDDRPWGDRYDRTW